MIEYVLFFALVLSILPKRNIEGIKKDCCGNLSSDLIDFNCADTETPEAVKRCYKASEDYDCDNCGNICGGEGECVPTSEGGYCQIDSLTKKLYKGGTLVEITDEDIGEKINDSVRARKKYKNLYANKCDPFASEMDVDELERKDRNDNYKGDDEDFDAIDKIESTSSGEDSSYIGYTIFAIIFVISVIIIILFREKIKINISNLFTKKSK